MTHPNKNIPKKRVCCVVLLLASYLRFPLTFVCVRLLSFPCFPSGLTLTAASTVYMLDPMWSAADEAQALNRAHRIGQVAVTLTNTALVLSSCAWQPSLSLRGGGSKRRLLISAL